MTENNIQFNPFGKQHAEKDTRINKDDGKFKEEMDLELKKINKLIEDELDEINNLEETPRNTPKTSLDKGNDPLEIKQSYNNSAKHLQEHLRRIGILKSDKTGRNLKASGLDN
jgi:hypothetical protein